MSDPWYLNRSQLALAFDVTPQRITEWAAAGMPVHDRGGRGRESRYALADCVAWRVATLSRYARESASGGPGGPVDLAAERARLTKAQTAKTLMDLGERRKQLLPADEVERVFGGCVYSIRANLLAIPVSVAERCVVAASEGPAAVEAILKSAIYDCLRALRQWPGDLLPASPADPKKA